MKKDKTNFLLGLASAIAVISLLGFVTLSIAYVKKGGSAGSDQAKTALNDTGKTNPSPSPSPTPTPPSAPTPGAVVDIEVTDDDHIRGNPDAPVTIVEYSDFQCPYCARFHSTMQEVMANYGNDVRWVYRHFPLDRIHPFARQAAEASECANEQGKFWEYADKLVENQPQLSANTFSQIAKELNLNTASFDSCLTSGKYKSLVESDYQAGLQAGVTGTPGNYINGQSVKGAVPYTQVSSIIDSLL